MKIKLLFFALMVGLGATAQVAFKVNTPLGVFGSKSFVLTGIADSTSYPGCWGNGVLEKKKVTGNVVYIATDGCDTSLVTENIKGKIVIANRGGCSFLTKISKLQSKGAIAVAIANNLTAEEQFQRDTNVLFTDVRKYANTTYPYTQQEIDDRMAEINKKPGYQGMGQILSQTECNLAKTVKVPAVMISLDAAQKVKAALINGNVNASIEKGLVDYDLAIDPNIAMPMYRSRPASMVKARMVHDTLGFIMINKGALTMKNVVADVKITRINETYQPLQLIYKDSIYLDSIDGSGGKEKNDTLRARIVFKSKEDLKVGLYEIYWKLRNVNNEKDYKDTVVDMLPSNNNTSGYFQITDSILSVNTLRSVYYDTMTVAGKKDTITYKNVPSFGGFLNTGTKLNDDFKSCQVYESDFAKGLTISSVSFTALRKLKDSLRGSKFTAYAYLWQPAIKSIFDANFRIKTDDITLLDSVNYTFNDFKGKAQNRRFGFADIAFKNGGIKLEDKARYLVCVATKDSAVMLGVSKSFINKWRTESFNNRILSPIYTNGVGQNATTASWFSYGWGDDIINSLAVRVVGKSTSSLEVNDVTNNLHVYPNPSNGTFRFASSTGSLSVNVTDLSGKVVYSFENKNHNALTHTFELEDVTSGMYVARIVNNGEMSIVKLQVNK